jgi:CubicO group peptidase (beta-lactamase class C family)
MTDLPSVTALTERAVDSGRIPGAIVEVVSDGQVVHCEARGVFGAETDYPLRTDTVLWLASLSKPIGAAALLMLADEGRLDLTDRVSAYLPEFASAGRVRVLQADSPSPVAMPFGPPPDPMPQFDIVPADRELTLFDLVTHTGGLQSIMVWNPEYIQPALGQTLADYVPSLGGLVRDFQPGQEWAYSNAASFDVLSRVIEIVSGEGLESFLQSRIFAPLAMDSTGFGRGGQDGAMPIPPPFRENAVAQGTSFQTTSAGLWGNAEDYLKFAEMLRTGGDHGRLLSQESITRMTTNQIGDAFPGLSMRAAAPGLGFGLAVAVVDDPQVAQEAVPPGSYTWDGMGTRRFWVSPSGGWSLFMYAPDPAVQREIEAAVTAELN